MAGNKQIFEWWRKSGFTIKEANDLTYGKNNVQVDAEKVYFSTPAVIARKERGKWIKKLKRNGWSDKQISAAISKYYAKQDGANPWDFIRENYRSLGTMDIKQYRNLAAERAKERTDNLYRMGGKSVRTVSNELGRLMHQ
jgi:hypothetical protein